MSQNIIIYNWPTGQYSTILKIYEQNSQCKQKCKKIQKVDSNKKQLILYLYQQPESFTNQKFLLLHLMRIFLFNISLIRNLLISNKSTQYFKSFMLNPANLKQNTVISQSFIASQFQGYTDNGPTSSLNQFVKSRPMHDSGFVQDGQKQTFGFDSISKPVSHQPVQLSAVSRQVNEQPRYGMTKPQQGNFIVPHYQTSNQMQMNINQQQQMNNNQNVQNGYNQGFSGQNYPQQQTNSPVKVQRQRYVSPNIVKMQTPNIGDSKMEVNKSSNYNQINYRSSNQYAQQGQSRGGSSMQESLQKSTSTEGRKFKMNISSQFSNSFTLNSINQPQRSNIVAMKKRARQFRKSLQNYII